MGIGRLPPRPAEPVRAVAEPGQRLLARIVDTLVVGLPVVAVAYAALPRSAAEVTVPVGVATLFLLYESLQLALWGRTLGKRIAGIVVVPEASVVVSEASREQGPEKHGAGEYGPENAPENVRAENRPGWWQALVRATVYALPMALRPVPVLGLIAGVFWVANVALIFERPTRQALHDRLARTHVVGDGS
jgi:uncharacterized RDD family membrane protein YckC